MQQVLQLRQTICVDYSVKRLAVVNQLCRRQAGEGFPAVLRLPAGESGDHGQQFPHLTVSFDCSGIGTQPPCVSIAANKPAVLPVVIRKIHKHFCHLRSP